MSKNKILHYRYTNITIQNKYNYSKKRRALFCFCFDNFIYSWFHRSSQIQLFKCRLFVTSSLFLVLVFKLVISKNPASHKYLEENSSKIFIAISNRTKYSSLSSIQTLYRGIDLNLVCIPVSV